MSVVWVVLTAGVLVCGCADAERDRLKQEKIRLVAQEEARIKKRIASSIQQAITPMDPKVRAFALRMVGLFPGEYNFGQVCVVWDYMKKNWRYVSDPRAFDYFAPAFESIDAGLSGDCDDFAILMASCIEAIGGNARIVLSYNKTTAHAYCEVFASDSPEQIQKLASEASDLGAKSIYFHRDRQGYWLNLDYSSDYPGGPFPHSVFEIVVYPDGQW
ncbi:MAG: transglutaminase family protein, partial [Pseudomonadota bacterium]